MAENHTELTLKARRALGLNQRTLGHALGLSSRTVQRWDARGAVNSFYLRKVAVLVHPKDPNLAFRIAHAAGTTMEALGVVPPPPPSLPPPARSPEMTRHMVDVVVCATADALALPPAAVRPALVAALRKSFEVGLTAEDIVSVLDAPAPRPAGAKAGGGPGTRRPT